MENREISRDQWPEFFEELNRRQSSARVTLRVLHPELGAQVEVQDLPLTGIAYDARARSIELLLGGRPGTNLEHDIARPERVEAQVKADGTAIALDVRSEGGGQTLLEFAGSRLEH